LYTSPQDLETIKLPLHCTVSFLTIKILHTCPNQHWSLIVTYSSSLTSDLALLPSGEPQCQNTCTNQDETTTMTAELRGYRRLHFYFFTNIFHYPNSRRHARHLTHTQVDKYLPQQLHHRLTTIQTKTVSTSMLPSSRGMGFNWRTTFIN
jgi:hypothetical protein